MTKLFWLLKPADRAKLMQLQDELYGMKLDIVSETPPWLARPEIPEIPVNTDMTGEELEEFMEKPPSHPEKPE